MYIFDEDKPFVVMPVCYHPTTVLAVDDEKHFLDALEANVSDSLRLLCFDNPDTAIEYVKHSRELMIPFAARLHFTGKDDTDACGLSKMLDTTVQDFVYPLPKDIDMSYAGSKKTDIVASSEDAPKMHETFDDFKYSQYIITESSLYYYNKLSNECDWVSSDKVMLKQLNGTFSEEVENLTSKQLDKITRIMGHHRPSKLDFSIIDVRNESYNKHRLKEIILVSTDYDMPGKNGIEFIKTVAFPGITLEHVIIILTGKNSEEFQERLGTLSLPTAYIEKDDPEYFNKFLELVEKKTSRVFQDCSYQALKILSEDPNEDACFVFDKGFGEIFTSHLKEHHICEMYLFDRQGSYLFLDENAELSWFIIRSDKGMENSTQKAIEYGAPESVVDDLKARKVVLSLYEEHDFSKLKEKLTRAELTKVRLEKEKQEKEGGEAEEIEPEIKIEIDWDKYLHPAVVFESKVNRLAEFGLASNDSDSEDTVHKYYYAFIKSFPESGMDKGRILSYKEFLNETPHQTKGQQSD
ncbi:MAG: hypothetical protein NXI01_09355 [Gammaproteobacteria bacterium]|nr:hypothetical protein [Gammaproteobacteria bacterium]